MSHSNCTTCNNSGFYLKRTKSKNIAIFSVCEDCDSFYKLYLDNDNYSFQEFNDFENDIVFSDEDLQLIQQFLDFIDSQNLDTNELELLNPGLQDLKKLVNETKKETSKMAIAKPFIAEIIKEEVPVTTKATPPASPAKPTIDAFKSAATNYQNSKNITPETTEKTMTSKKERAVSAAKSVGRKMQEGAVQGMVGQANREVISLVEKRLGERYPEFLKTTAGRKALEILVPSLVMLVCEMDENKKIPGHNYVRSAAELAVTNASADAAGDIVAVVIQEIMPLLGKYVEAGKMLEGMTEEQNQEDELPDFASMIEKSRVAA